MFSRHVSRDLPRYVDGDLASGRTKAVESHLAACERCRAALAEYKFAAGLVRQLSVLPAPPSIWASIEEALPLPTTPRVPVTAFSLPRFAFACLLALTVIAAGMYWSLNRSGRSSIGSSAAGSWEVSRLDDATGPMRMAPGEWVRTDASSRARITVGTIGTVDVEPGTHVRLGQMGADQFRIALDRGTISATINAPPRLFIVDTPTSTVVDLGCAYTMHVGADGGVELRVTSGWTSLEWQGMASLIPAGAQARTRPGMGPGTPSFEDASTTLREAAGGLRLRGRRLHRCGSGSLRGAGTDTLTLWHLLSRVAPAERVRVYDRIAALTPLPATVVRESVLALDPDMLKHLREELAWTW